MALASGRGAIAQRGLPLGFITAGELPVTAHIKMRASLQPLVDNSISKTINVPHLTQYDEFITIYDLAYDMGLKGCTTFRSNQALGAVLTTPADADEIPHCCVAEREAD